MARIALEAHLEAGATCEASARLSMSLTVNMEAKGGTAVGRRPPVGPTPSGTIDLGRVILYPVVSKEAR